MSEGNLDDLIIPDNEPETGSSPKSKSIIVLLALIVLLIIVGAVLAKMIFSSSTRDVNESKNQVTMSNTQKNSAINSDISAEQPKSGSNKADSDDLDKNMQVPDADLAPISSDTSSLKNAKTVSVDDNKSINNSSNINTDSEETSINNPKKDIPREEVTIRDNDNGANSDSRIVHKQPPVKHKTHIKHNSHKTVHSYGGKVYIQVGSFKKGPTEDFIDKIIRARFKYRIKTVNGYRRVYVGPFRSREEAKQYLGKVRSQISANAFIK